MYAVRQDRGRGGLTAIGVVLTVLVFLLMWRDDVLGSKAFEESGVPKTNPGLPKWRKGLHIAFAAGAILIVADGLLLVRILLS